MEIMGGVPIITVTCSVASWLVAGTMAYWALVQKADGRHASILVTMEACRLTTD
jgi:hypothetical protein